jgi:eukaryotic-like serine/threonine-protein kinase
MTTDIPATIFAAALDQAARPSSDPLTPGTRLGDYRIVRLIGAGGMGVVYLADQLEPVQRPVAIKLLQRELHGSLGLAYFNVERQALAQMQHPAIAQVYDAGTTPSGNPFFVMEYVDGEPITDAANHHQLNTTARIELYIKLCMGVHHAHQKGIVHRDIKPNNVLVAQVDQQLWPKLIDFGVALAVGSSANPVSSSARDRVGTAAYMSPEQSGMQQLDVDTRTDVYSLGVLLADLLQPRQVVAPSAELPPTLAANDAPTEVNASHTGSGLALGKLPSELSAIITKATEQDRELRYASAAALAEDLRRYLKFERVLAYPDSRLYRLRKLVRRNRLAIGAATLAMLGLIVGAVATTYSLIEAREQRSVAEAAAERALVEARKNAQTAEFLTHVFDAIKPRRAGVLDKTLMRVTLDEAVLRADRELQDQPEVRATIQFSLGAAYRSLGDFKTSLKLLGAAEEGFSQTRGADSESRLKTAAERLEAMVDNGDFDTALGEAQALYEVALRKFGANSEVTMSLLHVVGFAEWLSGDPKAAEKTLKQELATRLQFQPADAEKVLGLHSNLGTVYGQMGRFEEAIEQVTRSLDQLVRPGEPLSAHALGDLIVRASLNQMRNKPELVIADLAPNMESIRKTHGEVHPATTAAAANLGSALAELGRLDEAEPYYRTTLDNARLLYPPGDIRIAYALHNAGAFARRRGEFAQSLTLQNEANEVFKASGSKSGMFAAELHSGMAGAYEGLKRFIEARAERERAIATLIDAVGADHARTKEEQAALAKLPP